MKRKLSTWTNRCAAGPSWTRPASSSTPRRTLSCRRRPHFTGCCRSPRTIPARSNPAPTRTGSRSTPQRRRRPPPTRTRPPTPTTSSTTTARAARSSRPDP
uniref:(northern house mosquito) hypothetical protein n=1 Tax=Culex pipiens TaxID=7175 RepID=A0A8D8DEN6_CULPI